MSATMSVFVTTNLRSTILRELLLVAAEALQSPRFEAAIRQARPKMEAAVAWRLPKEKAASSH